MRFAAKFLPLVAISFACTSVAHAPACCGETEPDVSHFDARVELGSEGLEGVAYGHVTQVEHAGSVHEARQDSDYRFAVRWGGPELAREEDVAPAPAPASEAPTETPSAG